MWSVHCRPSTGKRSSRCSAGWSIAVGVAGGSCCWSKTRLSQLRLDMKYLTFDLEATRRERDELRRKLDETA